MSVAPSAGRRALVVSYSFAPLLCPTSIHLARMLRHLPEDGWSATVLTTLAAGSPDTVDPAFVFVPPDGMDIVRTATLESRIAVGLVRRISPGLLHIPDAKLPWLLTAAWAGLRLLSRRQYDVVFSYSHYLTSHLVGGLLSRAARLPWVCYFSDPWVDNAYRPRTSALAERLNVWMERRVFASASALVFTSPETVDLIAARYPADLRDRCHVMPHGFDAGDSLAPPVHTEPPGVVRLVHCGNFYGARSPAPVIEALSLLARQGPLPTGLTIEMVGHVPEEWQGEIQRRGLSGIVRCLGQVGYAESMARMAGAGALLLVDAPMDGVSPFLPQKLMDYLGTGRPVLGITPARGASARVLAELGHTARTPDDLTGIADILLSLATRGPQVLRSPPRSPEMLSSYESRTTTRRLAELFDRLTP